MLNVLPALVIFAAFAVATFVGWLVGDYSDEPPRGEF